MPGPRQWRKQGTDAEHKAGDQTQHNNGD
jgi:hypothetical protein